LNLIYNISENSLFAKNNYGPLSNEFNISAYGYTVHLDTKLMQIRVKKIKIITRTYKEKEKILK